jgi:DNA-damage-inducible protein D
MVDTGRACAKHLEPQPIKGNNMSRISTNSAHAHHTFEDIKHLDGQGNEFWYARALAKVLGYSDYRNFVAVIEKAMMALEHSNMQVSDHIGEVTEMVAIGSGAQRPIDSFALSRHACYLIVQNADPSKPVIANGQVYFAIQARRQELADDTSILATHRLGAA